MKRYLQLVRHFLGAGLTFGILTGLTMALATHWTVGIGFGVSSGCLLLLGVPLILTGLSGRRGRRGETQDLEEHGEHG